MSELELTAPGKLLALCIIIVGCLAYIIVAAFRAGIDTTPAWATLTLVTGYLIGNGTGARRGIVTAPIWAPTNPREEDPDDAR